MTGNGGSGGVGTVFKLSLDGTFTLLYTFCVGVYPCPDGIDPVSLIQATDGNFYGTTHGGGSNGAGTVFRITPTGTLTTLYSFCSQTNCADGSYPDGGVVQATDGNFYGTTAAGGIGAACQVKTGCGSLFKITPAGDLTTLYNFCSEPNCADGSWGAMLVQAADRGVFFSFSAGLGGTATSGTSLALAPSTVSAGASQPVAMTATVSSQSGGTPTGTVAFYSDTTYLGTAVLSNGVGTFSYDPANLAVNTYQISANYSGDATFAVSTSPAQTLAVTPLPPDYQVSMSPSTLTITAGNTGTATFSIAPLNGFSSQVSFACSGLPSEATCNFNPVSVTPVSGNSITSTLTISTVAGSANLQRPEPYRFRVMYAFLVPWLGVVFYISPSGRKARNLLGIFKTCMVVVLAFGVTSCGNSDKKIADPGSPLGTSTVTVTASTSGAGGISHSASLTITIVK